VTVSPGELSAAAAVPAFSYEVLDDLGDQAVAYVLAIWALRPDLSEADFVAAVVEVLTILVLQGEGVGRAYARHDEGTALDEVASVPEAVAGYRPPPADFVQRGELLGPHREVDPVVRSRQVEQRIEKAVRTLISELPERYEPQPLERVERLARDEPIQAAQFGYQDEIRSQGRVNGYRRGINPDACELCFWLWKEGYVYPVDQPMHRHTGCRCWPVPTNDRLGRHDLSEADQALLDDLYAKYQAPKKRGTP
jgi:hypothetical protein